jgi:hypothetical protein
MTFAACGFIRKTSFPRASLETISVECYDKTSPETRRNPDCGLHRNDAASASDARSRSDRTRIADITVRKIPWT